MPTDPRTTGPRSRVRRSVGVAAAALGAASLLASCTGSDPSAAPAAGPTTTSSTTTTPPVTSTAATTTTAARPTSSRGYLVKQVGQVAGLAAREGSTDSAVNFTVTSIQTATSCTGPSSRPPQNGQFLYVAIGVESTAQVQGSLANGMFNSFRWQAIGPDGRTLTSIATDGSFLCDNYEALPDRFAPVSQYAGTLVFDVPPGSPTLILTGPGPDGGGWEWPIPAS